jgi:hypothetical protein
MVTALEPRQFQEMVFEAWWGHKPASSEQLDAFLAMTLKETLAKLNRGHDALEDQLGLFFARIDKLVKELGYEWDLSCNEGYLKQQLDVKWEAIAEDMSTRCLL